VPPHDAVGLGKFRDCIFTLFEGSIGNEKDRNGTLQEVSHGPSTCGPGTPESGLPVESWIAAASVDCPACDTSWKKLMAQICETH
jgi:hypothetical protein